MSRFKPLRIAVSPWAGYQFMRVASQEGWLPPDLISLQEMETLGDSAKALREGRVDGAALTLDEVLNILDNTPASAPDADLSIVLVFDTSAGGDALLVSSAIQSLEELKGKRIAVESSSLGALMLRTILDAAGLQKKDVNVDPMDYDHIKKWDSDKPDAIITYEPALSLLESRGLVRLFDSRKMPYLIQDVLVVRTETLKTHGTAVRALIKGHFRALKLWRINPIDTGYRLSSRLGGQA